MTGAKGNKGAVYMLRRTYRAAQPRAARHPRLASHNLGPLTEPSAAAVRPGGVQSARADLLFFFDGGQPTRIGRRPSPRGAGSNPLRSRPATGTVRTAVQRKRRLPSRQAPLLGARSCAAVVVESGIARIAPPSKVDPSTDQCDRGTRKVLTG